MHNGRRYAFRWNTEKFKDPRRPWRASRRPACAPSHNLKPCLLDDHPKLGELGGHGLVRDRDGKPALAQFWDGLGYPRRLHRR